MLSNFEFVLNRDVFFGVDRPGICNYWLFFCVFEGQLLNVKCYLLAIKSGTLYFWGLSKYSFLWRQDRFSLRSKLENVSLNL